MANILRHNFPTTPGARCSGAIVLMRLSPPHARRNVALLLRQRVYTNTREFTRSSRVSSLTTRAFVGWETSGGLCRLLATTLWLASGQCFTAAGFSCLPALARAIALCWPSLEETNFSVRYVSISAAALRCGPHRYRSEPSAQLFCCPGFRVALGVGLRGE